MAIANITNNILTDSGVATSALQIALNGTGFVKIVGTTISYDNSTYYLASNPNAFIAKTALSAVSGSGAYNSTTGVITIPTDNNQIANGSGFITSSALSNYVALTGNQTIAGVKTFSNNSKFDGALILKNNVSSSLAGYVGLSAYSASGNKGINIDFDTYSIGFYFNGTLPYNYTFPNANGTVALTSDIPDVSGYVTLITAQTITGAKTFTSALNGTSATFSSTLGIGGVADSVKGGTYTPTLTNYYNISASSFDAYTSTKYIRIGNIVTVSGSVIITPTTASSYVILELSLPIASTNTDQGTLTGSTDTNEVVFGGVLYGGSVCTLQFNNVTNNSRYVYYTFTYKIT
jgi:hypothetical protein